ncbi:CD44 antigen isoform 4 [Cricetulus griseus]|nr:CD44 antigen isoform 4 [Cricetulus griseus]
MQKTLTFPFDPTDLNITCRYAGVFHVEKNGRYSISRTEAADLCQAFNSTLPTMEQMQKALHKGFETCRYGFIEGQVVIPRIHPNAICAANHTGVYVLTSNASHYDTYCFNASEFESIPSTAVNNVDEPTLFSLQTQVLILLKTGRSTRDLLHPQMTVLKVVKLKTPLEEDCTSVTDLPNSFDGPVTITIVNRDGTRYSKKGEYRTHPEDINATSTIDDDVSSGSSSEKSTSDGYVFHTNLPTVHSTGDQDDPYFIRSTPATISSTPRVSDHTKQNQDWIQWKPSHSNPEVLPQTTTRMTDIDRNSTIAHGENSTQEPQPPFNHHEYQDEEENPHATSTTQAAPSSTTEEAATQQEQWFENGWQGKYSPTPTEDSHVTAGATASTHNHPSQRMTTQSQENVSWTEFLDPISHPMGQDHQTERKDTDASHSTTFQPTTAPNTHLVEDLDRTGPLSVTTPQSHSQDFFTSHGEMEEEKYHSTTSVLPSSTRSGGRRGPSLPKDATTSLEGYTSHYPDTMENGTLTLVTPAKTGVFGETEATVAADSDFNVDGSLPEDQDSFVDPSGNPHTVTELAGHSSGSQDGGVNTTSSPGRKPQIPDWLIILASLLALALILAVCIAVNSRRRCGQKKKLVINSGNGKVEDRKPSELNGEASKSQEMVHLVNKEPSETPDQFMTADETRNLQNVDMKIGV